MEQVDCVVIGAGVVGLACARALALKGREVLILEQHDLIGSETSARNSEVIHAGIYYPEGSLKAQTCVEGRDRLYEYCAANGIPHRRCGKLIVATSPEEMPALDNAWNAASRNGVHDLRRLDAQEVHALEPALNAVAGLFSPSTGIIDSHAYMLALLGEAEAHGASLVLETQICGGEITPDGIVLEISGDSDFRLRANTVINAAGLSANALARGLRGLPRPPEPLHLAKGSYFKYSGRVPFTHLVYPVPVPGGLGIHLTLDLQGQARFGPDVEWVDRLDYAVDPSRLEAFANSVARYWPDVDPAKLFPDYSGIRPKIGGAGEPASDFVIAGPETHGAAGLVCLYGIESPGLTASLAIADRVVEATGR